MEEIKYLEIEPGWTLAYRLSEGRGPTWVFLNGLGDDFSYWDAFVSNLGDGRFLQIDLLGQGLSLKKRLELDPHTDFRLPVDRQSKVLKAALEALNIDSPIHFVAYSYGGGVALDFSARWPGRVTKLGLIVPYVIRLDHAFPMQRLWSWNWQAATGFGLIPATLAKSLERHYESFLSHYMNQRFRDRLSDPTVRSAAIELSHGIMEFDAFRILDRLPDESVHLLTSDLDTLVPKSLYQEFWRALPIEKRASWQRVDDGDHLLVEQKPELVLDWLKRIRDEALAEVRPMSEA